MFYCYLRNKDVPVVKITYFSVHVYLGAVFIGQYQSWGAIFYAV